MLSLSSKPLAPRRFAALLPVAAVIGSSLLLAAPAAHAQTPILDSTGGTLFRIAQDATLGFSFTVTGTQNITGLGFFDSGANGLNNSHTVGLFDNSGSLLTSTLVTNANSTAVASTSAQGNYRRVDLANSVTLTAGTYILGATYITNDLDSFIGRSTVSNTAGFTFGNALSAAGTALTFPVTNFPAINPGAFGPMAFTGAAVNTAAPEPGSLALLLPALGMAGIVIRKQKQRRHRN